MNVTWLRIKFWTKVVILAAVLAYIIAFIVENKDKTVELWFWYKKAPPLPLLVYTLIVFLLGVVAVILTGLLRGTVKQFQQLRRASAERRRERAAELLRTPQTSPAPPSTQKPKTPSSQG
jgi:uncharacterized integral membrane protein